MVFFVLWSSGKLCTLPQEQTQFLKTKSLTVYGNDWDILKGKGDYTFESTLHFSKRNAIQYLIINKKT